MRLPISLDGGGVKVRVCLEVVVVVVAEESEGTRVSTAVLPRGLQLRREFTRGLTICSSDEETGISEILTGSLWLSSPCSSWAWSEKEEVVKMPDDLVA